MQEGVWVGISFRWSFYAESCDGGVTSVSDSVDSTREVREFAIGGGEMSVALRYSVEARPPPTSCIGHVLFARLTTFYGRA
jgi:hypothetical protein